MLSNKEILDILSSEDIEQFNIGFSKIGDTPNLFEALFLVLYQIKKGQDYNNQVSLFNKICKDKNYTNKHILKMIEQTDNNIHIFAKCLSDLSNKKIDGVNFLKEVDDRI